MIPKRSIDDKLFITLCRLGKGPTLQDLICAFIVVVLGRNNGNRTHSAKELKIPLRTLRLKIRVLESLGYYVPEYETSSRIFKKRFKLNK
jgi:hypothetical protein